MTEWTICSAGCGRVDAYRSRSGELACANCDAPIEVTVAPIREAPDIHLIVLNARVEELERDLADAALRLAAYKRAVDLYEQAAGAYERAIAATRRLNDE